MNLLLLPGNSPRHKQWADELKDYAKNYNFESHGDSGRPSNTGGQNVIAQHYKHWETGEDTANVDYEIKIAGENVSKFSDSNGAGSDVEPTNTAATNYAIIAKSIGTVIALKAAATGVLKPSQIVLLGVPINGSVDKAEFASWLEDINVPVTIIQNTEDPLGTFADIQAAFSGCSADLTFVESGGEGHDYLDFEGVLKSLFT